MSEVIAKLSEKGFLVSPGLSGLKHQEIEPFLQFIGVKFPQNKPLVLSKEIYEEFLLLRQLPQQPQVVPETSGVVSLSETDSSDVEKEDISEPQVIVEPKIEKREQIETKVKLKKNYEHTNQKISINEWVTYYLDRYNKLRDMLANREELRDTISIGRALKGTGHQRVSLIGMIKDIHKTFSNTYIIELEDPTGIVKVSLKNQEVARKAEELVHDEVIGVTGTISKDFVYAENIVFPEIPEKPIKKAEDEVYSVFISDIHTGSNMFLPKEFEQCIDWISGRIGNDKQRELAKKIRYLFIVGDLVDGVGVYPSQENELMIHDIYAQYQECAKYLAKIPEDIHIIAIPGNHDALRLAEPQPVLFPDIAAPLYKLPNMIMASNPSVVNIHNVGKFPGFDVLLYHGYSLDYYATNVPSLRKYGYERADLLQEFLLRKRHLAPTHGSTLVNPGLQDFLVIDKLPDIFATGHIHYSKVGRYKNILNLCCGCFQDKTVFQEKVGHNPQPGRVPVVNLMTNQVKIMRFR